MEDLDWDDIDDKPVVASVSVSAVAKAKPRRDKTKKAKKEKSVSAVAKTPTSAKTTPPMKRSATGGTTTIDVNSNKKQQRAHAAITSSSETSASTTASPPKCSVSHPTALKERRGLTVQPMVADAMCPLLLRLRSCLPRCQSLGVVIGGSSGGTWRLSLLVHTGARSNEADFKSQFLGMLDSLGEGPPVEKKNVGDDRKPGARIRVGSDCAGYCSEALALELCNIDYELVFACEKDRCARHICYQLHGTKGVKYYKDVTRRDHRSAPMVDLYVFGPPCQGFAKSGAQAGVNDPRSFVLLHCLEYIKFQRPTTFLFEESDVLLEKKYEWLADKVTCAKKAAHISTTSLMSSPPPPRSPPPPLIEAPQHKVS